MGDPCRYRRYADRPQMSLRTKRYYVSCTGLPDITKRMS